MVDIPVQQIGFEMGGGALIGGIIGFAAKQVAKIVAIIVGLQLALFKFLETRGVLTVDWGAIRGVASEGASQAPEAQGWLMSLLSTLPVSAGFTGGFLVGFKQG